MFKTYCDKWYLAAIPAISVPKIAIKTTNYLSRFRPFHHQVQFFRLLSDRINL